MKRRLMILVMLVAIPTADASACGLLGNLRGRVQQRRDARSAKAQPATARQSCAAPAPVVTTHTVDSRADVSQVAYERIAPVSGLFDSPCANGRCPKH